MTARVDVTPDLQISADGEMLARVFENLLSNAVRYGVDGKYIDIKAYVDEGDAVVEVVNYGSYIAPENVAHIFDVFLRRKSPDLSIRAAQGLACLLPKILWNNMMGA